MTFAIKPIRNETDYTAALTELKPLFDAKPEPGTERFDRFEVLLMLVDAYESERYPITLPDPVDAILFYMEQSGHTAKDLADVIGSKARASQLLNRKRPLSLSQIRAIHAAWGIAADILVQESQAGVAA